MSFTVEEIENMDLTLEQIQEMKKILEEKEKETIKKKYQGKKVLGFKLYLIKEKKGQREYFYWQAYTCNKGKQTTIKIGKDPAKAEQKIKQYMKRHREFEGIKS